MTDATTAGATGPRTSARPGKPGAGDVLPQYKVSAERHDAALDASFPVILRQLPQLAATAMRLAWAADRRAVLWLGVLQLVGGALTALALYGTRGALAPMFAAGPVPERLQQAMPSLILITTAAAARSLTSAAAITVNARIGPRVDGRAELAYLDAATRVPLASYDDPDWCDHSEAANRASKDLHLMTEALAMVTASLIGIAAAAGILAALHPMLLPLLILAVIPRGVAAVYAARAAHHAERHTLADRRLRHTLMYHTAGRATALDVRVNTMRSWLLDQFSDVTGRLERHAARVGRSTARFQLTGDAIAGASMVVVYASLLWLVTSGRIPLSSAGAALIATQTSRILLTGLVNGINTSYKVGLYLADWSTFITDATARTRSSAISTPVPDRPKVVRANHVSFSYPGSSRPVLTDVSVAVHRGEVLAIVGANGAGKSTLAKLLAGLYTPTSGTVTWDDTDLAQTDPEQVHARLAMLPQDIARWQTTARHNITLGQGGADDAAVLAAARAAGADEVLAELPDGLDTDLSPSQWGGRDLSGGQWQRLAAARAFHRDRPVLLCDEPTSALDPHAEEAMYERIRSLAQGRTVILITHRLGSTRTADRILVLGSGRVLEEGNHEQLLATDGAYAAMWRKQAATYSGATA
ncbi:ABC transporter ATP-binding protein [Streptomyces sp. NBC_01233]|uniref:ABC transporter ATP-binding protein n=1 Tax=Streptomyces sp. NBC_01233 TaxID=2903787 RepID=UPI002E1599C2|nr:ABC transporter ATP-binding protein/permease [Streptomyces sp. NBC_01233]